jgi:Domain of unknown function (DUF4259)
MNIASRADHPVLRPGGHLASRMGISAISLVRGHLRELRLVVKSAAACRGRHGNVARVETWGPGAFDNDDALDLLDTLTRQDAISRRQALGGYSARPASIPTT